MKKRILTILLIIVILPAASIPVVADEEETHHGKLGLGFDMNLYPGEEELEIFAGLHARLRFNETVGVEAEIHLRSISSGDGDLVDITSQPLSFSLMYFLLPKSILAFYLFGGITFSKPTVQYPDSTTEEIGEWERGLHGGIGIETPLSSSLVLHGEIRYNNLSFTLSGFEFDYSGLTYSGGLSFYF